MKFKLLERGKVDDVYDKINRYLPDILKKRNAYYTWIQNGTTLAVEVGNFQGVVVFTDLIMGLSANAHVYVWDKTARRKDEDARYLLKLIFMLLGLKRIEARPPAGNEKVCKYAERLGFTREGTLRKAARYNDALVDVAVYSLLEEELNG